METEMETTQIQYIMKKRREVKNYVFREKTVCLC